MKELKRETDGPQICGAERPPRTGKNAPYAPRHAPHVQYALNLDSRISLGKLV
jgi:hypothetical protein